MFILSLFFTLFFANADVVSIEDYLERQEQKANGEKPFEQMNTVEKIDYLYDQLIDSRRYNVNDTDRILAYLEQIRRLIPVIVRSDYAIKALAENWGNFFHIPNMTWAKSDRDLIRAKFSILGDLHKSGKGPHIVQEMLMEFLYSLRRKPIASEFVVDLMRQHELKLSYESLQQVLQGIDGRDVSRIGRILLLLEGSYSLELTDTRDFPKQMLRFETLVQVFLLDLFTAPFQDKDVSFQRRSAFMYELNAMHPYFIQPRQATVKSLDINRMSVVTLNFLRQKYITDYALDLFVVEAFIRLRADSLTKAGLVSIFSTLISERTLGSSKILYMSEDLRQSAAQEASEDYRARLFDILARTKHLWQASVGAFSQAERAALRNTIFSQTAGLAGGSCKIIFE